MPLRLRILVSALAAASLALSGCGAFEPAAAVVGPHTIEDDEFVRILDFVLADPRFAEQAPGVDANEQRMELIRSLLTFLIQQEVVDAKAEEEGIEVEQQQVESLLEQQIQQLGGREALDRQLEDSGATIDDVRGLLRDQIVRDRVIRAVVEEESSEEELRATYEERAREFTQAHLSHILVRNEAQARRIANQATPQNFARLARQFSQDPGSAESGGDLGTHPVGDFVEPFANAALEIPVGEIGGPVETEFGYHIIYVQERESLPFEEVRSQLIEEQASQIFGEWLLERLRSLTVRVNPRYGLFDEQTGEVVPRTATTPLPGPQVTP